MNAQAVQAVYRPVAPVRIREQSRAADDQIRIRADDRLLADVTLREHRNFLEFFRRYFGIGGAIQRGDAHQLVAKSQLDQQLGDRLRVRDDPLGGLVEGLLLGLLFLAFVRQRVIVDDERVNGSSCSCGHGSIEHGFVPFTIGF
ncbi:hypothetical protein ACFSR7_35015 [Cohnella sp. GCM10020058]|uniref:hypothetical protein n=1 Tax=Cohnella sp. GCM10020058 TaxID=3317330 RepID=UPI0036364B33